ncbi:MAG TPA: glycosyltransferase [Lachnospiraceae bacterium]|nr:glycosyltransferase [Lachnospiraceae bacterium]
MDKLYIVIPAYNEEENIEEVVKDWYPVIERHDGGGESRLVVINDGSRDSTFERLSELKKERPLMEALTKPNSGHGPTLLYGYDYAIRNKADYIFQTDSDGQTLPEEFEGFWALREQYDMVIGSRAGRQDGLARIFVTKTLKAVIRLCFKVDVTDANTPYRLMKARTLEKYTGLIPKDYFLSNVLISVIYKKKNLKVKYIPITFRPRQGGVNSINMKRIFGIGKKALKEFREINKTIENS